MYVRMSCLDVARGQYINIYWIKDEMRIDAQPPNFILLLFPSGQYGWVGLGWVGLAWVASFSASLVDVDVGGKLTQR